MEKLITSMVLALGLSTFNVHADTMKDGKTSDNAGKSVQEKKNDLPDSRKTGDYLKKESGKNPNDKAVDMDKSTRTKEEPKDGGMDLESK